MSPLTISMLGTIIGATLGAWITYFLIRERMGARYQVKLGEAEKQTAVADARAAQVRSQLEGTNVEIEKLRKQLADEQKARTSAETTLATERQLMAEEKSFLQDAKNNLADAFAGLAAQALVDNNKAFLHLASQSFAGLREGAAHDLEALLQPLTVTLESYESNLKDIESSRQSAYGELTATLGNVRQTQELLKQETSNLVTSLRRPNVRGRWGELTLRRVAELTGMSEHCDFEEHATVTTEDGPLRPDMIIHLPGDVIVPVDAKCPFDAYLDAIGTTSEEERKRCFRRHAAAVRERMKKLSSKEYENQFPSTPGLTVLFLPNDAFLSAALENDPSLLDDAMQKKVVIATPVSLFSLLKAVAHGWQQEKIAQNAQVVSDLGKQLYERMQTLCEHFRDLRSGLLRALEAFDAAAGSLESRVLPGVRKFKELGATAGADIEVVEPIGRPPRSMSAFSAGASSDGEKPSA